MRILLTTDTVGGVWTFTRELAGGLLVRGHTVALVSFGREPSVAQSAAVSQLRGTYGEQFRYTTSRASLEWMQDNESAYLVGAELLLRVADGFAPDLMHTSQFCFGTLPVAVPRLVTAHSDVFSWAEACRPEGLAPSPWLDRYRALVQAGLDGASAVTAPTRWMADALRRHLHLSIAVQVIPNGRSVPHTAPRPRKLQAVSAGRLWDEAKNLSLLTELRPPPMPLLVAGEVAYEGTGTRTARGSIKALGALAEPMLLELFRESSIYLAPSLYEPFGLAPLEAALCGCAILAKDIPSLREVWGDAALYFRDAAQLTELLRSLADEPATLEAARARSQGHARTFTAARMANAYVALYTRLCAPSIPAPSGWVGRAAKEPAHA